MSTKQRKKLRRSTDEKIVAGICGGLGQYTGIAPARFRLIFVLLGVAYGIGIALYLLLWYLIPAEASPSKQAPK